VVNNLKKNLIFTVRCIISSDAQHSASLCLFFDKLFDSLNGNFDKFVDRKIDRTSVKKNSGQTV
jgi:hypothetical protein